MAGHLHLESLRARLRTENLGDANPLGVKSIAQRFLQRLQKGRGVTQTARGGESCRIQNHRNRVSSKLVSTEVLA